jgi:hypothetical protein
MAESKLIKKGDIVSFYGTSGNACAKVTGVGKKFVSFKNGACSKSGFQPFPSTTRIMKKNLHKEISHINGKRI